MTFQEAWEELVAMAVGRYCDLRVSRKSGGEHRDPITTAETYVDKVGFGEGATYEEALLVMSNKIRGLNVLAEDQLPTEEDLKQHQ